MKTNFFNILTIAFVFLSIGGFPQNTKSCAGLSNKTIDISEGCHYSWGCYFPTPTNPNTITSMKPLYRTYRFDIKFHDNCQYDIPTPTEWQKVMAISKVATLDNSIRLGWRNDNTSEVEVGLYGHTDSDMAFLSLHQFVETGEKAEDFELILAYHGLYAKAGQNGFAIKRKLYESDEFYTYGYEKKCIF
jgi:hypothetical protein